MKLKSRTKTSGLCSDKSFIKYHSYVHGAFVKTQTLLGVHRKVARTSMGEQQEKHPLETRSFLLNYIIIFARDFCNSCKQSNLVRSGSMVTFGL